MDLINTAKLPIDIQKFLVPYVKSIIELYSSDVVSVFAYGSVTGADFDRRYSDINLGVVLKEVDAGILKKCAKIAKRGLRHKITPPLFLTREYINVSLDTFPVEFINMKCASLILYGEDTLKDIKVNNEDLRRECETQIKGKIITIRQAYLEQALRPKGIERVLKNALRSIFPVFAALLRIKKGSSPVDKNEILREVGEEFDIDISPFMLLYMGKKSERRMDSPRSETLVASFLSELAKLSKAVDTMEV